MIGADFGKLLFKVDGKIVSLKIWDFNGQQRFIQMNRNFYRDAHCVFLFYDITKEKTFVNLTNWIKDLKENFNRKVIIYLIGNKCEMQESRAITYEKALNFASEHKIQRVFETSAKTGFNV